MKPFIIALGIIVALLVFSAVASAESPISSPSVASDGAVYAAMNAGRWYWTAEGYKPCADEPVFVYTEVGEMADDGVAARGTLNGCGGVWFERGYLRMIRRLMARHPVDALAGLCYAATHEQGHNIGFEHDTPAHEATMADAMWRAVRFCRQWARQNASVQYTAPMKRSRNTQPKVRSHVGLAAHQASGAGKHGGSAREQRRKDRQNMKRALRAGSEA